MYVYVDSSHYRERTPWPPCSRCPLGPPHWPPHNPPPNHAVEHHQTLPRWTQSTMSCRDKTWETQRLLTRTKSMTAYSLRMIGFMNWLLLGTSIRLYVPAPLLLWCLPSHIPLGTVRMRLVRERRERDEVVAVRKLIRRDIPMNLDPQKRGRGRGKEGRRGTVRGGGREGGRGGKGRGKGKGTGGRIRNEDITAIPQRETHAAQSTRPRKTAIRLRKGTTVALMNTTSQAGQKNQVENTPPSHHPVIAEKALKVAPKGAHPLHPRRKRRRKTREKLHVLASLRANRTVVRVRRVKKRNRRDHLRKARGTEMRRIVRGDCLGVTGLPAGCLLHQLALLPHHLKRPPTPTLM